MADLNTKQAHLIRSLLGRGDGFRWWVNDRSYALEVAMSLPKGRYVQIVRWKSHPGYARLQQTPFQAEHCKRVLGESNGRA